MGAAGITLVGRVRAGRQGRRGQLRRPVHRRTGQRRRAAVPVPAVRGAGRAAHRVHPGRDVPGLRRDGPRGPRQPRRRVHPGRGQPGDGPPDRARRHVRRRRAGRAVDLRVPRAGRSPSRPTRTTSRSATCTAGRPCPRRARWSTAGRRSRSTSASRTTPRRVPGRGHPDHPGQDHRHPDHRGPPAAHRARHRRRTRRPRRGIRRRLPAGLRPGTRPGGAAGGASPTRCPTPWRCASTRSSPLSVTTRRGRPPTTADRSPGRAVRRLLRRAGRRRPRGCRRCSSSCTTSSRTCRRGS